MSLSQKVKAEYKGSINDVIEFEEKNIKFEISRYLQKRYWGNENPSNTINVWFIKLIQHNPHTCFYRLILIIKHFFY